MSWVVRLSAPSPMATFTATTGEVAASRLVDALRAAGWVVGLLEGPYAPDSKSLILGSLAAAFSFPDGFGWNWDAALDCLYDLSWLGSRPGYAYVVADEDSLERADPDAAATIRGIFEGSSRTAWERQRSPIRLVLIGN